MLTHSTSQKLKKLGPQKTLEVTVKQAKNLAPKDSNGFADPYVIAYCQEFEQRTRSIPQTLNPQWNEKLTFSNLYTLSTGIGVTIQVWDHDMIKDDFQGEVLIQLDHSNGEVSGGVLQNATVKGWFDLKARQGRGDIVSGQLELKIRYS